MALDKTTLEACLEPGEQIRWMGPLAPPPCMWGLYRLWLLIPAVMAIQCLYAWVTEPIPMRLWWVPAGCCVLLALFAWLPGWSFRCLSRRGRVIITDRRFFIGGLSPLSFSWRAGEIHELQKRMQRDGNVTFILRGVVRMFLFSVPSSEASRAEVACRALLSPPLNGL